MRFCHYEVCLNSGVEDACGYVYMRHGATYRLHLHNRDTCRVDAKVTIDGKLVGVFRIDQFSQIVLERPINDNGKFTFFRKDSKEGKAAGGGVSRDDSGLIEVTFMPERKYQMLWNTEQYPLPTTPFWPTTAPEPVRWERWEVTCGSNSGGFSVASSAQQGLSAGVTGLTGRSSQRFTDVRELDYDVENFVTIYLRLVEEPAVRPLVGYRGRSSPIPSPV